MIKQSALGAVISGFLRPSPAGRGKAVRKSRPVWLQAAPTGSHRSPLAPQARVSRCPGRPGMGNDVKEGAVRLREDAEPVSSKASMPAAPMGFPLGTLFCAP